MEFYKLYQQQLLVTAELSKALHEAEQKIWVQDKVGEDLEWFKKDNEKLARQLDDANSDTMLWEDENAKLEEKIIRVENERDVLTEDIKKMGDQYEELNNKYLKLLVNSKIKSDNDFQSDSSGNIVEKDKEPQEISEKTQLKSVHDNPELFDFVKKHKGLDFNKIIDDFNDLPDRTIQNFDELLYHLKPVGWYIGGNNNEEENWIDVDIAKLNRENSAIAIVALCIDHFAASPTGKYVKWLFNNFVNDESTSMAFEQFPLLKDYYQKIHPDLKNKGSLAEQAQFIKEHIN